jgi:hypothetical protein
MDLKPMRYTGGEAVHNGCATLGLLITGLAQSSRRDGGTGRRSGLKIRRGQPRGGSTPPPGTKILKGLSITG